MDLSGHQIFFRLSLLPYNHVMIERVDGEGILLFFVGVSCSFLDPYHDPFVSCLLARRSQTYESKKGMNGGRGKILLEGSGWACGRVIVIQAAWKLWVSSHM